MKTFSQKPADVTKKWVLIDAENLVVGRLASIVASRLRKARTQGQPCGKADVDRSNEHPVFRCPRARIGAPRP